MELKHEIKAAYDQVHAPDAAVEKIKQELYQKDLYEDADEAVFEADVKKSPSAAKYFLYIAASLALCTGCILSVWGLHSQMTPFTPASTGMSSTVTTTVTESTEPTTEVQP